MIAIAQGRIARVVWHVIPLQTPGNTATLPEFEGLNMHQLLESIKPITQQIADFLTQHILILQKDDLVDCLNNTEWAQ